MEKEGFCVNDQNNNQTKIIDALFSDTPSSEKKPRSSGGRRYNRSGRSRKPAAPAAENASAEHLGLVLTAAENQAGASGGEKQPAPFF